MQKSLEVLTHLMDESLNLEALEAGEEHQFEPAFSKDHHHALPHHSIITLDGEVTDRLVTVHNPGAHARTMMVTLYVSTYYIKVGLMSTYRKMLAFVNLTSFGFDF